MKRFLPLCALLCATLPAFAFLDANNNGLSDLWERAYNNGQLFGTSFDPQADADGDGWTNAQEAGAGTNPFYSNPPEGIVRPQLTNIPAVWSEPDENGDSVIVTPASMFMEWQTIPGKQYTLLYSPDLIEWLAVPNETFIGSGSIRGYGIELTDDKLFWRLKIEDVDSDGDGLSDSEEYALGTDSATRDTDHDGVSDWDELVENATDPLQALDLDADGMADDLEKHLAKQFLVAHPDPAYWGTRYQDLLVGNLDPTQAYTADNTPIADLVPILTAMAAFPPGYDLVFIEPQYRNNSLSGLVEPAPPGGQQDVSGTYYYSLPSGGTGSVVLTSTGDFVPGYLSARIDNIPWVNVLGANAPVVQYHSFEWLLGEAESLFGSSEQGSGGTISGGEIYQRRSRLLAAEIPHAPIAYDFVKITTRESLDSESGEELIASETVRLSLAGDAVASAWLELKAQITDGMIIREKIISVSAAVDFNRDGTISLYSPEDTTTPERPFVFWTNVDYDKAGTVDETDWEEDDVEMPQSAYLGDAFETGITCRRDLEDFARIQFDFSALYTYLGEAENVELFAHFEAENGQHPAVQFYLEVPPEGGRNYLTDNDLSYNQIHAPYGILCGSAGTSRSKCLPEMWKQPQSWGCSQLIFEGVAAGKGKLVFELRQGDKTLATLPPVYMDLRAVEDMYETFTVGDVDQPGVDYADTTWPAVTFTQTTGQALPAPQTAEEKDYILFVHGWNMEPWEKTAYADTMFKRLWHQCYKGRFGAFRWPTFWFDTPIPALDNFNASELHAWNSASRLKALIENRAAVFNVSGASKVRLYAHSMGNIVASECLRQFGNSAAPVHTYISAQAALSARAWDTLVPTVAPEPVMPDVFGHFWQPGSSNLNAAGWGGNPSYLAPSAMPTNTIFINHYNRLDWALANWRINTRLKPGAGYEYVPQNGCFLKSDEFPQSHYMSFPDERYDALAFAAQSYSFATGAEEGTSGKFDSAQSIDLTNYFLTPEERENNQMADKHKHHSGQFRSTIQKRWTYWREALVEMDTETPK